MKLLFLCAFLLITATGFSQDKIESDRPDQTENTHVLKPAEIQVEAGFIFDRFNATEEYIGRGLIRYGVAKKIELRLLVEDGKERDIYIEKTAQGNYPLAIGAKLALLENQEVLPNITLIGYLELPFTAHTREQASFWSAAAILAFENEIGEKLDISYNAGIKQNAFGYDYAWQGAIAVQYDLSEKLSVFIEYFGQYQKENQPQHNADAGLIYLLTNTIQLDMSFGSELFNDDSNLFAGCGIAFRLPK